MKPGTSKVLTRAATKISSRVRIKYAKQYNSSNNGLSTDCLYVNKILLKLSSIIIVSTESIAHKDSTKLIISYRSILTRLCHPYTVGSRMDVPALWA